MKCLQGALDRGEFVVISWGTINYVQRSCFSTSCQEAGLISKTCGSSSASPAMREPLTHPLIEARDFPETHGRLLGLFSRHCWYRSWPHPWKQNFNPFSELFIHTGTKLIFFQPGFLVSRSTCFYVFSLPFLLPFLIVKTLQMGIKLCKM